ncbi:bifunctional transcriptional activator/DNA repair enzyme AdaA [Geomicrobium sp. JSM 1781026]|uniref:bifunctional transcriptional activator/DNA repair enzyme AdaA n=1 Tax=unclassified Geomicrobium TaxID=2628951 RepID=UPI0005A8C867|nr:Ada metal-binding domain-containing protein [Geomicrobium sp. JCM 19037]
MQTTDNDWQAIVDNDSTFDSVFVYAVQTTKIYCKPSCRSRQPNRSHVQVFQRAEDAERHGYRPCKRCEPQERLEPNARIAQTMTTLLRNHLDEPITLSWLSMKLHKDSAHLQKIYKAQTGETPKQTLTYMRIQKAAELLVHTHKSIAEIARTVGYTNRSSFQRTFEKVMHSTPQQFRNEEGKR